MADMEAVMVELAVHMADMVDMVGPTEAWAHILDSAVVIQTAMVATEDMGPE